MSGLAHIFGKKSRSDNNLIEKIHHTIISARDNIGGNRTEAGMVADSTLYNPSHK